MVCQYGKPLVSRLFNDIDPVEHHIVLDAVPGPVICVFQPTFAHIERGVLVELPLSLKYREQQVELVPVFVECPHVRGICIFLRISAYPGVSFPFYPEPGFDFPVPVLQCECLDEWCACDFSPDLHCRGQSFVCHCDDGRGIRGRAESALFMEIPSQLAEREVRSAVRKFGFVRACGHEACDHTSPVGIENYPVHAVVDCDSAFGYDFSVRQDGASVRDFFD